MNEKDIRELNNKAQVRIVDLKTKLNKVTDEKEIDYINMAIKYNQDIIMQAFELDLEYLLEN